jgi:hypothetical protein
MDPYFFACQSSRAVHSKASGSTIFTIHGSSEPLTVFEPFIVFELIGFLLAAALSQYLPVPLRLARLLPKKRAGCFEQL